MPSIKKQTNHSSIKEKKMKTIRSIFVLSILGLLIGACSDSDDTDPQGENPLEGLHLLESIQANGHTLEIYSKKEAFVTGYNELFLRIKDQQGYVPHAELSWKPVMHMASMVHSCPKSAITTTGVDTLYQGYIIFQMPGNADEYWELSLHYGYGGALYELSQRIQVREPLDGKRTVNVFTGSDQARYVLAMLPLDPKVAINEISALLFKMENMMEFPALVDHSITLDPRMPGMGNHSSPNNVDLAYDAAKEMYTGKLSLTMTGYWRLNLKLLNPQDQVLKGEDLTEEIQESSLFFELEF